MKAKWLGVKKTPDKLIELIRNEVEKLGQNGFARATGLPLGSVQKYLKGSTEPTEPSLIKLADYFEVSVAYLRGEVAYNQISRSEEVERVFEAIHRIVRRGNLSYEDMTDIDSVSTGFAALVQDAFQLENVLQKEEGIRESTVNKRVVKELKELSKEIDALADQYITDDNSDMKKE